MAISTQTQLFGAEELSGPTPRGGALDESPDSPESFVLSRSRDRITRRIERRDGRTSETRFDLRSPTRKRTPSQSELAAVADAAFLQMEERPKHHLGAATVRVADLFSGCGIMSLGVGEACRALEQRMETVVAIDMNRAALKVYADNFPGVMARQENIQALLDGEFGAHPTSAEKAFVASVGAIDVLIGGPPCQGHSNLNNHTRRDDPKNGLYARMARFAELFEPSHLIIENVPAVLHDRNKVVTKTQAWLTELGYAVDQATVEVAGLGVAQRRKRHVLVASRVHTPDVDRWVRALAQPRRSVGWAIGDLRKISHESAFDALGSPSAETKKRIAWLFRHGKFELPDTMRPDCHRLKAHSYKSVYGRMHWDEPAQTITSGFTSMGQGRYVHPMEQRTITPHEAARLQFIPDFFRFDDSIGRTALSEMIGNAVPAKLAYVLALQLLR